MVEAGAIFRAPQREFVFSDHSWVNVTRTFKPREMHNDYGCWFHYMAPPFSYGDVSVNVGRTCFVTEWRDFEKRYGYATAPDDSTLAQRVREQGFDSIQIWRGKLWAMPELVLTSMECMQQKRNERRRATCPPVPLMRGTIWCKCREVGPRSPYLSRAHCD